MQNFDYQTPTRLIFGRGVVDEKLPRVMAQFGKRILLTYGGGSIKRIGLYDEIIAQLKGAGIEYVELSGVEPNPRITSVRRGVELCREHGLTAVLAVGGGSVIDSAKAIAMGADAVIIARPFVSAVYGGGEEGVKLYIDKIGGELSDAMTMCGAKSLKDITPDMVFVR